jgi:hypothetical protein
LSIDGSKGAGGAGIGRTRPDGRRGKVIGCAGKPITPSFIPFSERRGTLFVATGPSTVEKRTHNSL